MDVSIQFTKLAANIGAQANAVSGAITGQNFSDFMSAVTARSEDPAPVRDDPPAREPQAERFDNREEPDHRTERGEETARHDARSTSSACQ